MIEQLDESSEQAFAESVTNVCIKHISYNNHHHHYYLLFLQFLVNSNLNCSSSNNTSHDMTFLNNNNATTTVLPDFQYLTSPLGEQPFSTTTPNHIPMYPIPKSEDVNQYGNNITNNNNLHSNTIHVNKNNSKANK